MAIADESAGGTPFAKITKLGEQLVGAWAGCGTRQQVDYNDGKPKWKKDGKPLLEEINHFIVMPTTTAKSGTDDSGFTLLAEGDRVRFSLSGFKWGQAIEARKNLPEFSGFRAGQMCSSDVYLIRLVGWSAESVNREREQAAGFTVENGRVILRTDEERLAFVQMKMNSGGNVNPAKDLQVACRRIKPEEKRWEQLADEWYLTKPWLDSDSTPAEEAPTTTAPAPEWGGMATDPPVQPAQQVQQQRPLGDAWGENSVMKDPAWQPQQQTPAEVQSAPPF
jgi:hypothetical protein